MHSDHFVDQLRVMSALEDTASTRRVLAAFKDVPREAFAGPGPWKLRSPLSGFSLPVRETPDADPRWLYHSVLIVLDEEKGINIGDPSLWVRNFARAEMQPGSRVLQVGAGVGYYTAILSHLTGSRGAVVAYEIETALADRAASNLETYGNVAVRHGDATADLEASDQFDFIVSFAGVTHVPATWTAHVSPDARLLLPLTGKHGWGAMILAQQTDDGFEAVTVGRCGFYPCDSARDDDLAEQVNDLFADPKHLNDWRFRIVGMDKHVRFEPCAQ